MMCWAGWLIVAQIATAETPLLCDFEQGTDGWTLDWGLKQNPTNVAGRAKMGTNSLALVHEFKKKEETVGVHLVFPTETDFTSAGNFEGFSAWVYFPKGNGWEAQFYYHAGSTWEWRAGPLFTDLQPGWHQLFLRRKDLGKATAMLDLGIQVKNYRLNQPVTVSIDRVEALYSK